MVPIVFFVGLIMFYSMQISAAHTRRIIKRLPVDGFPEDDGHAAEIKFYKTDPAMQREIWKARTLRDTIIIGTAGIFVITILFLTKVL